MYILGPCGSLQWTLLWGLEILPLLQSPQIFITRDFDALFPHAGTLACGVCLAPQFFLLVYPHANVGLPILPVTASPALVLQLPPCYASSLPTAARLHPSYQFGWVFLLKLLGCQTFIQFDFLAVLVTFCFWICCCLSIGCGRGGKVYVSIPPSWLEVGFLHFHVHKRVTASLGIHATSVATTVEHNFSFSVVSANISNLTLKCTFAYMPVFKTITITCNLRYVHWTWLHHVSFPLAMTVNSIKPKPMGLRLENGFSLEENQGDIIISMLSGH